MTTTTQQLTDKTVALRDNTLSAALRANETIETNLKGREEISISRTPQNMRVALVTFLALLSGCMATGPVRHNILFNPSDVFVMTGLTDTFNLGYLKPAGPENEKNNFTLEDKKVIWWAELSRRGEYFNLPTVTVQWIMPDGNIYKEERKSLATTAYISASLPIKGTLDLSRQGEWKLRVFIDGNSYEEKSFIIGNVDSHQFDVGGLSPELKEKLQIDAYGAVGLFNNTVIRLEEDGSYKIQYYARVKIINERGKRFAEIFIPFNNKLELYRIVKAYTIDPSGKTVDSKETRIVALYPGYPTYTGNVFIEFSMPAVEIGSVIEYQIEVVSMFPIIKDRILFNTLLPFEYPVLSAEIQCVCPKPTAERVLNAKIVNSEVPPEVRHSDHGQKLHTTWRLQNQQALTVERLLPPYREFMPELIVSDYSSWDEVAAWAKESIKPKSYAMPELKKLVDTITRGSKSDMDSAKRIFRYIQDNIRYVAVSLGNARAEPQAVEDILKNKYGDCKDCSILLNAMLDVIGLKAYRALVRTKDQGGLYFEIPFPYEFNHVISFLEIEGKPVWLDSTDKYCAFGKLPVHCQGVFALVLKDNGIEFVRTPAYRAQDNEYKTENTITLENSSDVKGIFRLISAGDQATEQRRYVQSLNKKERDETTQTAIRDYLGPVEVTGYDFIHLDDLQSDFITEIRYRAKDQLASIGNLLAFAPLKTYHHTFQDLKGKDRVHDVVLSHLFSSNDRVMIDIPVGYRTKELPKDFSVTSDFCSVTGEFHHHGRKIDMVFKEKIIRDRVKARDYQKISDYRQEVAKYLNQQVVLDRD